MMESLRQRWEGFSARERLLVGSGAVVVALAVLFLVLVDPLLERTTVLDRQQIKKRRDYEELVRLESNYRGVQTRIDKLEQRLAKSAGAFALLPYLEETATSSGIRQLIVGMQPQPTVPLAGYQETAVEVRLAGMQLPQLLSLLSALEQAPGLVQIKRLQITPQFDMPHLLQVTLRVASYEKT
ncbi:MAG: type II secretion system protein GspM [Nitrospiraceae bacterium]